MVAHTSLHLVDVAAATGCLIMFVMFLMTFLHHFVLLTIHPVVCGVLHGLDCSGVHSTQSLIADRFV